MHVGWRTLLKSNERRRSCQQYGRRRQNNLGLPDSVDHLSKKTRQTGRRYIRLFRKRHDLGREQMTLTATARPDERLHCCRRSSQYSSLLPLRLKAFPCGLDPETSIVGLQRDGIGAPDSLVATHRSAVVVKARRKTLSDDVRRRQLVSDVT